MKKNLQSGQISRILIVMAIAILVIIVIVFLAVRFTQRSATTGVEVPEEEEPEAVYDVTVAGVRFLLESATDMGSVLPANLSRLRSQEPLVTTEKFIKVIVRAQNKGLVNTRKFNWSLGNIIDSESRNFISIDNKGYYYLPYPNLCGDILKPEFEPTPCTSYYEVSRVSKNLKIQVNVIDAEGKKHSELLDLRITP